MEHIRNFPWWFGGLLGATIMFLVLAGLLLLISRLIFWGTWRAHRRPWWRYRDEALEILKARYARGEITKEQYLEMKKTLEER